jgi:hypothetical protein
VSGTEGRNGSVVQNCYVYIVESFRAGGYVTATAIAVRSELCTHTLAF